MNLDQNIFLMVENFPTLPDDLVQECMDIIMDPANSYISGNSPVLADSIGNRLSGSVYHRYRVSDRIYQWVIDHVPPAQHIPSRLNFKIGIQVFHPVNCGQTYDPHTDGPRGDYILNYLIDAGGDNVLTKWYHQQGYPLVRDPGINLKSFENLIEVYSHHVPAHTWFRVYGRILHTVVNIERPRIALSLGLG